MSQRSSNWADQARVLASSLGLYAPALLGLATVVVMLIWLLVLRHLEPPRLFLDQAAAGVLRLWLVLTVIAGVTLGILRAHPVQRGMASPNSAGWHVAPVRAALLWAPALLWLYFVGGALLVAHVPPHPQSPSLSAAHRSQLHSAVLIWLATSVLVAAVRSWNRRRKHGCAHTTAIGDMP